MSNPSLNHMPAFRSNGKISAQELRELYDAPAAQGVGNQRGGQATMPAGATPYTQVQNGAPQYAADDTQQVPGGPVDGAHTGERMTYRNTASKVVFLFVILLGTALVGWNFPALALPAAIIGLVLGLVNTFKKKPSPALIILYAAVQGVFLGGISGIFNAQWSGIVIQAVLATLVVFAVTLLLFTSGKVRTSPRMTKIVLIAMVGYFAFSLVNFGLMMFGVLDNPWGMRGIEIFGIPLGAIIGVVAVLMAAYMLVMDFEAVQLGVQRQVPERYGWSAAFGLMVTIIWLYVEILRLIAIFRGND